MSPFSDIDVPGSLTNSCVIAGFVIAAAITIIIGLYVYNRRKRAASMRAESIDRMWINVAQYEGFEISEPPPVHVQEGHRWPDHYLAPGEFIELDQFPMVRPRPCPGRRSKSLRRRSPNTSPSRSTGSSLDIDQEGRVWYSRPVGGEYDDEDIDSQGRVRWLAFGSRRGDEESSVAGGSFVTAPEN